jgi:tricorn protease
MFDKGGKYLYLFGSTDAGPVQDWFAQSNADMRRTRHVYLVVLRRGIPSPLAKESDEEKPKKPEAAADKKPEGDKKAEAEKKEPFSIDVDGVQNRILALSVPAGDLFNLQVGDSGHFYYQRRDGEEVSLHHYDLVKRKDETPLASADSYMISDDAKKVLYTKDRAWFVTAISAKMTPGEGRLAAGDIEVRIDPRAEWTQIFNEA